MAAWRRSRRSEEKPTDSGWTGVMSRAGAGTGADCWACDTGTLKTRKVAARRKAGQLGKRGILIGFLLGAALADGNVRHSLYQIGQLCGHQTAAPTRLNAQIPCIFTSVETLVLNHCRFVCGT